MNTIVVFTQKDMNDLCAIIYDSDLKVYIIGKLVDESFIVNSVKLFRTINETIDYLIDICGLTRLNKSVKLTFDKCLSKLPNSYYLYVPSNKGYNYDV